MDDKYYYKLRSIQSDLEYLKKMSDESECGLIQSEDKRKICRLLLADILNNTKSIQDKMGKEFISEFQNG